MRSQRFAPFLLCCCLVCPFTERGTAQTFTNLHTFNSVDYVAGSFPLGALVADAAGTLYGATSAGGAYNPSPCSSGNGGCGVAYSLSPPAVPGGAWTETVLWNFGGTPSDGALPSPVVLGSGGTLYGTTNVGGANGDGTVFSLTPPVSPGAMWAESVLWNFGATGDGGTPAAGVMIGAGGALYGTTTIGGTNGEGTVFSLTPPTSPSGQWTERVLWNFGGPGDGWQPTQGLVAGRDGVLYGSTSISDKGDGNGLLFSLSPPASPGGSWTETILYTTKPADGTPAALTIGKKGMLFGAVTGNGRTNGGTIFSLTPPASQGGPWTRNVLWTFPASRIHAKDGEFPSGPLLFAKSTGRLYGTTREGGTGKPSAVGTAFELRPPGSAGQPWTISILQDFDVAQGGIPTGSLIRLNGILYGTLSNFGPNGGGTVFSLVP